MAGRFITAAKGYLDRRTPGYLIFFVTPRCNCRCKMCFYLDVIEHAEERQVLTFDEIERFTRNFPGLHQVNFSGGEPFLREDFPAIPGLFYRHSGTRGMTIPTNSTLGDRVIDGLRAICRECPEAWIRLTQSLDGVGAVHDGIRGVPGLFDRVVALNRRLERLTQELPNLSVGISTVFSYYNKPQAHELLDYVYDNLYFNDFGAGFVRGAVKDPQAKQVEAEAYVAFQQECIRRRREHRQAQGFTDRAFSAVEHAVAQYTMAAVESGEFIMPCHAGRRMVVLDDQGDVLPCEILQPYIDEGVCPLPTAVLGNLRDYGYDIRKILSSPYAREVVNWIIREKCHCTFECATAVNTAYNPGAWPRVLANFFRT